MMQNSFNTLEVYSPSLPVMRNLISRLDSFSISVLNLLNALDFSCKIYVYVFLVQSAVKVIKYPIPPFDYGLIGPHMSE